MPLPDYGFGNRETRRRQELVFKSPPIVADDGRKAKIVTSGKKRVCYTLYYGICDKGYYYYHWWQDVHSNTGNTAVLGKTGMFCFMELIVQYVLLGTSTSVQYLHK